MDKPDNMSLFVLIREFPNWDACTLSGTFAYLKGYLQG